MTHRKITRKVKQQPDTADADFAARANQLIEDSWHLPPEGDQTWRDQDARRIFRGNGKDDIKDRKGPSSAAAERREPGFKAGRPVGILLPLSLATFIVVFAVAVSVPEVLTAGFWNAPEPKAAPAALLAPVNIANAATPAPVRRLDKSPAGPLRPTPTNSRSPRAVPGPIRMAEKDAAPAAGHRPAQLASFTSTTGKKIARRHSKIREPVRPDYMDPSRAKPAAGPDFAAGASNRSAADWKAEAAKWDEMASAIRERSEKYQKDEDTGAAESYPESSHELP